MTIYQFVLKLKMYFKFEFYISEDLNIPDT